MTHPHIADEEHSDEEGDDVPLTGRKPVRQTALWRHSRSALALTVAGLLAFIAFVFLVVRNNARLSENPLHRSSCLDYPEDCRITAPFIFDTIHSLLKQWPNTYAPNGHSIISASLPPNTPLYHARPDGAAPKVPTFFAFDAEMSLGIYGGSGTPQLYTMRTTRWLNLIYLDGMSASLTRLGTLDAQMALLQNGVPEEPNEKLVFDEDQRALDYCALVKNLRVDGVVRMNAGFEVMLCDYVKVGVEQLYSSNVTVPGNREREEDPKLPQDPNRVPPNGFGNDFAPQNSWEWIRSGTWHYGTSAADAASNRESRVQLDFCGFLTYYDPFLRSLSNHHHAGGRGQNRYQNGWGLRKGHRLLGISHDDINTVKSWLQQITTLHVSSKRQCSETNWQALTETITDQHRSRAREILAAMRITTPTIENIKPVIQKIHELSHAILYTYLQYPTAANIPAVVAKNLTITRCSSVYAGHIENRSLNEFEVLIKESINIVVGELCSWEWEVFEWSELHTSNLFGFATGNHINEHEILQGFQQLLKRTETTMKWVGWDGWYDCERKCESNELCYIPMWPVIYAPGKHQGGMYADDSYTDEELHQFWRPKCLNRTLFDRGGGRGREPSHQLPDVPSDGTSVTLS